MSLHLSRHLTAPAQFSGVEGQSLYHFPHVTIEVCYKEKLTSFGVLRTGGEANAAALAEIWVWTPSGRMISAFPFSPNGRPLGLANLDQLVSIFVWARELTETPPPMSTAKKRA